MNAQHVTANTYGKHTRFEKLLGRRYLVAPVVLLTPGVHNGSNGPLYYPPDELAKTPEAWNMRPVVVYHPANGTATTPEELATRMVGILMNAKWDGKLRAEVWLDTDRLEDLAPEVGRALLHDEMVEVSTGLFTDNEYAPGEWGGERYEFVARNHVPDHLALLPEGVGACSVADGCGLLQTNKERVMMNEHDEDVLPLPVMNFGGTRHTYAGQATPAAAPVGDDGGLPMPTMNFGDLCGCKANAATGGPDAPLVAPACVGTPGYQPTANAATGGDDGDETPLVMPPSI
jgi:hypothetical protein